VPCKAYKPNNEMMDGHFVKILQESLGGCIPGGRESPPRRPWQSSGRGGVNGHLREILSM